MSAVRASNARKLRGLKNISWLTARQLDKLYNALTITIVEKRGIIFDDKHTPNAAYILLSGVARISCRDGEGSAHAGDHGRARNGTWIPAAGARHQLQFSLRGGHRMPNRRGRSRDLHRNLTRNSVCRFQAAGGELPRPLGLGSAALCKFHELHIGRAAGSSLLELYENLGIPDPKGVTSDLTGAASGSRRAGRRLASADHRTPDHVKENVWIFADLSSTCSQQRAGGIIFVASFTSPAIRPNDRHPRLIRSVIR